MIRILIKLCGLCDMENGGVLYCMTADCTLVTWHAHAIEGMNGQSSGYRPRITQSVYTLHYLFQCILIGKLLRRVGASEAKNDGHLNGMM